MNSLFAHYREDTNDILCRATHCTHTQITETPRYCPCCASVVYLVENSEVVYECIRCKKEFFIRRIV
jgi:hypothetical protein